jgi:hypothetical protein
MHHLYAIKIQNVQINIYLALTNLRSMNSRAPHQKRYHVTKSFSRKLTFTGLPISRSVIDRRLVFPCFVFFPPPTNQPQAATRFVCACAVSKDILTTG